jgi:formyltetrahydrofolate-dependent phosphoribosylglycinamide formyltransferase
MKIAVVIGNRSSGSNMRAIVQACQSGAFSGEVQVVIAGVPDSPGLEVAQGLGVRTEVIDPKPAETYAERFLASVEGCDTVCLAGYLRLLPLEVLRAFPDRVLNIHPALLPKFGGKGMYGRYVHEAVIAARESFSGCTVHLVSDEYDKGRILLQKKYELKPGETAESLAAEVLKLEHQAYVEALRSL